MASSYSQNLRLELIGAGEQAGTWGTTTNTNLGTLLDQAIAGYISVAVASSAQAFTVSNGGPDEARNATIKLTTSTSAAFAVYAPPVAKQYIIYNSTSYNATIYNSTVLGNTTAAGSGVVIAPTNSTLVWSDGTNFFSSGSVEPTGTVKMWAGAVASPPTGYLACTGAAVSRTTYASLYAVIGTTFGSGDGSTTFNLPNLQDRFPIGAGNTYSVANTGGATTTTSIPAHTHSASFSGSALGNHSHGVSDPGHRHAMPKNQVRISINNVYVGTTYNSERLTVDNLPTEYATTGIGIDSASAGTPSGSVSVSSTGDASVSILNPYIGIGFIIKT